MTFLKTTNILQCTTVREYIEEHHDISIIQKTGWPDIKKHHDLLSVRKKSWADTKQIHTSTSWCPLRTVVSVKRQVSVSKDGRRSKGDVC